jgi:hypothetical protein
MTETSKISAQSRERNLFFIKRLQKKVPGDFNINREKKQGVQSVFTYRRAKIWLKSTKARNQPAYRNGAGENFTEKARGQLDRDRKIWYNKRKPLTKKLAVWARRHGQKRQIKKGENDLWI